MSEQEWITGDEYQQRTATMREYKTQVIYQHPKHGRVLWATKETNEALIIVECIESGRLPILHVDKYNPLGGPDFDMYDDELHAEMYAAREDRPDAELQSTSRAAELLRAVEARPATRDELREVARNTINPDSPVGTQWTVAGSTGTYTVTVRPDTVHGGRYLECTCPSWKFRRGQGQDCKHIIALRAQEGSL